VRGYRRRGEGASWFWSLHNPHPFRLGSAPASPRLKALSLWETARSSTPLGRQRLAGTRSKWPADHCALFEQAPLSTDVAGGRIHPSPQVKVPQLLDEVVRDGADAEWPHKSHTGCSQIARQRY
jgi:hypothetical protein